MSKFHYEIIANETDFEEMVCEIYNAVYKTNTFQLYKSRGSNQYGIDIFSLEEKIVIQCKKKDPIRKDSELRAELKSELRECVTKAHGLPFPFKTFILATTTKKYGDVQDSTIELSNKFPFSVQFVAWGELEKYISRQSEIRNRYYPHLRVEKVPPKADKPGGRLPIMGTIGANAMLKASVIARFNKLGEQREKRFGKSGYSVMYKKFKTDFGIKNQPWTCIWDWPEATAHSIQKYLEDKYTNTIAGRIENNRSKADYVPSRPQLIVREKVALSYLGLEMSSPEVRQLLDHNFGVTSHTKLTHLQYWHLVVYLEEAAKSQFDE